MPGHLMKVVTVYGIKNCDTVKKARAWLDRHAIAYTFCDFRSDGLDKEALRHWCKQVGWEALLNRRSRSWKELSDAQREGVDEAKALQLMGENPTLVKRPVVVVGKTVQTGFSEAEFGLLFGDMMATGEQGK